MSSIDSLFQTCKNEYNKLVSTGREVVSANLLLRPFKIRTFIAQMEKFGNVIEQYLLIINKDINKKLVSTADFELSKYDSMRQAYGNDLFSDPNDRWREIREDEILKYARNLIRVIEDLNKNQDTSTKLYGINSFQKKPKK